MVLMKIAIAGTNGLAQLLAHEIETTTTHQFIFLSRRPMEGLSRKGWQVVVVDYSDNSKLRFKLAGIDVVLSTVLGDAQIALIEAAAASSVQLFVPSEFAGPPSIRPSNDLLDNGRRRALLRLAALESGGMKFCAFSCGVLYERFGPGGLSQVQIARGSGMEMEGSYLVDIRRHTARIPARGVDGQPIRISMISLRDLAKAVVAALGLKTWPHEFRVRGDRLTVDELVEAAATMRGMWNATSDLRYLLTVL